MPQYLYIDEAGHTRDVFVRMLYTTAIVCECGRVMHRKPQVTRINWSGLRPSAGEVHPNISRHVADTPRRLDNYLARREKEGER